MDISVHTTVQNLGPGCRHYMKTFPQSTEVSYRKEHVIGTIGPPHSRFLTTSVWPSYHQSEFFFTVDLILVLTFLNFIHSNYPPPPNTVM